MNVFPDEILLRIFDKCPLLIITRIRLTCRRFHKLGSDKSLKLHARRNKLSSQTFHGAKIYQGKLYMWGYNHFNRLMDHHSEYVKKLSVTDDGSFVKYVSTRASSTIAITEHKQLYIWGYHYFHKKHVNTSIGICDMKPRLLCEERIIKALFTNHEDILALTEAGEVLYWNRNNFLEGGVFRIKTYGDRGRSIFCFTYILGFVTESGKIYLSNYDSSGLFPKSFELIDFTHDCFPVKLIEWQFGLHALIIDKNDNLLKIPIDQYGKSKGKPALIQKDVCKALICKSPYQKHKLRAFLTHDGRVGILKRDFSVKWIAFGSLNDDINIGHIEYKYNLDIISSSGSFRNEQITRI
jgi:hypothetical protein